MTYKKESDGTVIGNIYETIWAGNTIIRETRRRNYQGCKGIDCEIFICTHCNNEKSLYDFFLYDSVLLMELSENGPLYSYWLFIKAWN